MRIFWCNGTISAFDSQAKDWSFGSKGTTEIWKQGKISKKEILDQTELEKKAKFKAIAMRAKNKPTFLQSQFVGQDAAGCFLKI